MSSIVLPRPAARGIGIGLALMAVFTVMWAGWAYSSVGGWFLILGILFWAAAVFFASQALHLFASLGQFPQTGAADSAEGRVIGRRFGMVFSAEGILIGIVCGVLGATGHVEFFAPAIALVVGLHFIPLAWVFHRRIDIWLGVFTALVGIVGLWAIGADKDAYLTVWAIVGFATAAVTTAYGVMMTRTKTEILNAVKLHEQTR